MSLIKCSECGKEVSDLAKTCPNCGAPIFKYVSSTESNFTEDHPSYNVEDGKNNTAVMRKKHSTLSIVAFVLSFLGYFSVIGLIVAIVDLVKKNVTKKHGFSIAAIVISIIVIFMISLSSEDSTSSKTGNEKAATEVSRELESNVVENESPSDLSAEEVTYNTEPVTGESLGKKETDTDVNEDIPHISKEDFIASCQEIPYKTLARNPEDYIGQPIVLTVKITQILQGGWLDDGQYYRVYTNDEYDIWMGDEYFMYDTRIDDDMKILQDDIIKVYAEFAGVETVTRALTNTNEEVPAFKAMYIELVSE